MVHINDRIPTIEKLLDPWKDLLGSDYRAYRNHVYRVVHFCEALYHGSEEDRDKYAVAACFHDIGIWTNKTFDYLDPSVESAKAWLNANGKTAWLKEIELMIYFHHKMTRYRNGHFRLVEIFRQADWIDVTRGRRSFGLPREEIDTINDRFPDFGFHDILVQLTKEAFKKHPFRPLPMIKW